MAQRFLRLDLAAEARDFEPVAVEPGLPLLDRPGANFRSLRKWLGRFVAEPAWHGHGVDLFVCDDQQNRLTEVRCEPASADEMRRNRELMREFDELVQRLEKIKPEPKEAKLHEALLRHFRKVTAEATPSQKECHFFKYRDGGCWRLVWGWGFQRKDLAPASPTVCTNPNCALLFVRQSEGSRNCPACESTGYIPPSVPGKRFGLGKRAAIVALVALVAGAIGYGVHWYIHRNGPVLMEEVALQVTPSSWKGPAHSRVQFAVTCLAPDGKEKEDVTTQVVAVVDDPHVLRLDSLDGTAQALSTGQTKVHFYYRDFEAQAEVQVEPAKNPTRLRIAPDIVELGVGTTARLTVWGEFGDGQTKDEKDLTEAVEWEPIAAGGVYCDRGRLEGTREGERTLTVRYRAAPEEPYLKADAKVIVLEEKYKSLELSMTPGTIGEGEGAKLEATVTTETDKKRSVLQSSQLNLEIEPAGQAMLEDDRTAVRAGRKGAGELKAAFRGLLASQKFQIESSTTPKHFEVRPNPVKLAVGQTADLQVVTALPDPISPSSSAPEVVEVLSGCRVVGRAAGKAELTITQEARQEKVPAEVVLIPIRSIAVVPGRISVPVDRSVPLRLVGRSDKGEEITLSSDRIVWEKVPTPTFAVLDMKTLQIRGVRPTGEMPQTLTARYGELRASAQVDVSLPPLQIELTPAGPLQIPSGLKAQLRAWAKYGDGRRVEVSDPSRLTWKLKPEKVDGLELDAASGMVRATKAGAEATVVASHEATESNPIKIQSVAAPASLLLSADHSPILVGDTGQITASTESGPPGLAPSGIRFESSDPNVLKVDPATGAYEAIAPGPAAVKAGLEKDKWIAQGKFEVVDLKNATLALRPAEVVLTVGGRQRLDAYLVIDGKETSLPISDDPGAVQVRVDRQGSIEWKPPMLIATAPSKPLDVTAAYRGKTAHAKVEVREDDGKPTTIRIVPATASLRRGQPLSPRLEQQLPGAAGAWQEVDPTKAKWNVPPTVRWTAPTAELGPQLTPAESAEGQLEIGAEYAGAKATLTIDVDGGEQPEPGRLSVAREPVGQAVTVGNNQRFTILSGTEPVAPQWQPAFENEFVRWAPPVLTALRPGHEQQLEASVGGQKIGWSTRTVLVGGTQGTQPAAAGSLHLFVGETKWLGTDVPVPQADSASFDAVSSDPSIVRYNRANRSIFGVAPGQTDLVIMAGGNRRLRVTVDPAPVDGLKGTITVEPATATLAEGEGQDLHVILVTADGQRIDRTGSATLRSTDPAVLATSGSRVTGIAAGEAGVMATLPGIKDPGTAAIQVTKVKFERLLIVPDSIRMAAGDEQHVRIQGVVPGGGRRELASHPDLKVVVAGKSPGAAQWLGGGVVRGVAPGQAELQVKWRDLAADPAAIEVSGDPPTNLRIEPPDATVGVNRRQPFLVFARRGGQERCLTEGDGVELQIADTSIARRARDLTAVGAAAGTTEVTAVLGAQRAVAMLHVVPNSAPTLGEPGLRFIPDILRLQLGVPGAPVRLVRISADGQEEDVVHRAAIKVADTEVCDVKWTAAGPVFEPKKLGETEATASQGKMNTASPLVIRVVDTPARLEASPDPLRLAVGETGSFRQVRIVPEGDGTPIDVDYQVQSADPAIATVEAGKTLRGVAAGQARVTISPVNVGPKFGSLTVPALVEVAAPSAVPADARLELVGPSQTTAGAEVPYRVELVGTGYRRDVTNAGARLVLPQQEQRAEVRPGCVVAAKEPGTVELNSLYDRWTSNILQLRIDPVSSSLQRLEMEIDPRPMSVGETREYKVWGYPTDGSPRQDLTGKANLTGGPGSPKVATKVTEPDGGDIVGHQPPAVVAKAVGRFQLAAALPQGGGAAVLRSNVAELQILGDVPPIGLRAEPPSIVIGLGELTPQIQAVAQLPGDTAGRTVTPQWTVVNDKIVAPVEGSPGVFKGMSEGATRIRGTLGSLETVVDVTVLADGPFKQVVFGKDPDFSGDRFSIIVNVQGGDAKSGPWEYRLVLPGNPEGGEWKPASVEGGVVRAELTSPLIRTGPRGTQYHLLLEARKGPTGIAKYPLSFNIEVPGNR